MRREIVIHSLDHARAALAAAGARGVPVILASAPGAALQTGPAWFKAVIDQAREEHPGVAVTAILDCGDQPGAVMAALRVGLTHLRFAGAAGLLPKLEAMGAILVAPPDSVLDLLDVKEPEAACAAFLGKD
ncbi:MAG TPA: class II fructose-bisphosphate aldolase [Stellaceae bacterium]|nr:class II fructose-bisphosphate aldolase [Stellaceae bacterium]